MFTLPLVAALTMPAVALAEDRAKGASQFADIASENLSGIGDAMFRLIPPDAVNVIVYGADGVPIEEGESDGAEAVPTFEGYI